MGLQATILSPEELRERNKRAGFSDDFEREQWQHAACLSIAEGVPGWDDINPDMMSPAMEAVQRLRALCETWVPQEIRTKNRL